MNIEALRKGDQAAFRQLIDMTHRDIFRLALKFTSNQDDAKDIAQEVYLEAFRNIAGFREEAHIKTWLYRITVNRSLNLIRRNQNKHQTLSLENEDYSLVQLPTSSSYHADQRVESKELKKILNEALSQLPENQKTAFLLHNHDGMSYNEIAEIMNLSLNAVESLIFRSRSNLKKILGAFYEKNYSKAQVLQTPDVK